MCSDLEQILLMAHYNQLMNQRLYSASSKLSKQELKSDRGAYFKSVLGTLNHIMVGDILWLKRFAQHTSSQRALAYVCNLDRPQALNDILFTELTELKAERERIDDCILLWVTKLSVENLSDCISYTSMNGGSFKKPFGSLINHMFLHQIHHRGQVTTLLSQSNLDFGETDIIEIVPEC